jgi:prepilin-type N-terminal cleavage/methylation domain-containing protein
VTRAPRRRGFTLVELGITLAILVGLAGITIIVLQQGGNETREVGQAYADNYTAAVADSTSAGYTLPTTWGVDKDGQTFTIMANDAGDNYPGTYIYRHGSTDHYAAALPGTNGPWQAVFGCLATNTCPN